MKSPLSSEQWKALDTDRHLAVVANAGSGKTRVLTYRYLWLLVEHRVEIENIVAITFTTKAAAEMRERVRELIQEMLEKPDLRTAMHFSRSDDDVLKRLQTVRRQLGDARISTFHSFCAGLLRQFGHVVEIDPESVELSDRDTASMRERALRTAMHTYMADRRDEILDVYESVDFGAFEKAVASLARSAERFQLLERMHGASDPIPEQRDRAVRTALVLLGRSIAGTLSAVVASLDAVGERADAATIRMRQTLTETAAWLQDPDRIGHDAFKAAHAVLIELYTKGGTARKKDVFPGSRDLEPIDKKVLALAEVLGGNDTEERDLAQATVSWHAARVAELAHTAYTNDKRERNAIDFDDMMSGVVHLLEDQPEIASYVSSTISHLMVDEYQDTNPTQYRLMQLLVPQLEDPTRSTGPRVFVVGDDKQSIYGFRDADVRLFRRTVDDLSKVNDREGANAPTLLTLATSYRMASPLAEATNRLCAAFFEDDSEYDVPYAPLVCGRSTEHDAVVGSLQTLVTDLGEQPEGTEGLDRAEREAHSVVQQIVTLLNKQALQVYDDTLKATRPVTPGDIAVLCRRTVSVTSVATGLHATGVPFQVHGGRAFFSRPEVADIRNLLTTAVDPDDALALAAVLRSPLFRWSDAELATAAFSGTDRGLTWASVQLVAGHPEARSELQASVELITSIRDRLRHEPPTDVVRDALVATDWHATIFEHPRCAQMLANIEKLLQIIREAAETPGATLRDVLDAISIPDSDDREAESAYDLDPNAVQVMTIHAAKGLEFPVVVLCDLSGSSGHPDYILTDQLGLTLSMGSYTMWVDSERPVQIPKGLVAQANAVIKGERDHAEARRLLYVALTRGKDHVFVSFVEQRNKPDEKTGEMPLRAPSGAMATLLQPLLLEEQLIPQVHPPALPATYTPEQGPFVYHDRTEPIAWDGNPLSLSVTQLLTDESSVLTESSATDAATLGTIVHDTLEDALRTDRGLTADALVQRAAQHPLATRELLTEAGAHLTRLRESVIWRTLSDVATERTIGALLDDTLLYGRVDAMRITQGSAEVWDWKTNAVTAGSLEPLAEHYGIQMQAYAWILLSTLQVASVTTRLVFTTLIESDPEGAVVEKTYTKEDIGELARILSERRRMVVSA